MFSNFFSYDQNWFFFVKEAIIQLPHWKRHWFFSQCEILSRLTYVNIIFFVCGSFILHVSWHFPPCGVRLTSTQNQHLFFLYEAHFIRTRYQHSVSCIKLHPHRLLNSPLCISTVICISVVLQHHAMYGCVQRYSIGYYSELWTRSSLVRVPSWCQYSMRLDQLHIAYPSLHPPPPGVVHRVPDQLNIDAVTGTCELIDGCSLELCSATPWVASSSICHTNKVKSIAWLSRDGLVMTLYQLHTSTSEHPLKISTFSFFQDAHFSFKSTQQT